MLQDRRSKDRKFVDAVKVKDLTSLSSYNVIANTCYISDASPAGFLLIINRKDIAVDELKDTLSLEKLVNQHIVLYLPEMNLDLDGTVRRSKHLGKGVFEVGVEFSADVPEYWRECLIELLPEPGELSEELKSS